MPIGKSYNPPKIKSLDWYYLSFAAPKFKGAIIVQGVNLEGAKMKAERLGANTDWHCMGVNITAIGGSLPNAFYLNRMLSKKELENMELNGEKGVTKVSICENCAGNGLIEVGRK